MLSPDRAGTLERPLRVLVACEFSGVVRDAFRARGHDAVSCDLLPSEAPGPVVEPETVKGVSPRGKKYYSLNWLPQNDERWKIRSRTFQGIADAMADQWGSFRPSPECLA